ncbi:MAG: molybdopterin molybdotransferase MoeA [Planctomycetota bacterium]
MISPEKALHEVLAAARPLKALSLPLHDAFGHCLAGDVRADRDQPPTDRSAMDGFAVRAEDLANCPRQLRLIGEVAAGSSKRPKVVAGTCARILTGGRVPPGADTVVKVEDTSERDGEVHVLAPTDVGTNIRRRAENVAKGEVVLAKGTVLGAAQSGVCAAVGKATVRVHRRPEVMVFCTGEELRPAGESVRAHQLRDANGPALRAALAEAGFVGVSHRILPDDPKTLARKLEQAVGKYDVVVLTGGVSVGKYDYVPDAVRSVGAGIRFHGVSMKPGKPQLYATLTGNRHIFGLPGNPLSVLTGFFELVLPAVRRLSGVPAESCQSSLRLVLAESVRVKPSRTNYVLAELVEGKNGLTVRPMPSHGSADLAAGARADGALIIPKGTSQLPAGEVVEFRPWRAIL